MGTRVCPGKGTALGYWLPRFCRGGARSLRSRAGFLFTGGIAILLAAGCIDYNPFSDWGKVTISGTVSGADSVTVTLSGGASKTRLVRAGGKYSFEIASKRTYVVTPAKVGFVFSPASYRFASVHGDSTGDFTASVARYTLSGTITGADGVTLTISGDSAAVQTMNRGEAYSFSVLHGGAYALTPMRVGYLFSPENVNFASVTADRTQDFAATYCGYTGRIAFSSFRSGIYSLYVMNADGARVSQVTSQNIDRSPSWSPDGTKIAFSSFRYSTCSIYTVGADGTGEVRLTEGSWSDTAPAWSPDGTKIAFASDRDGDNEIYILNADGSGEARLTDNSGTDRSPSWSPDGTKIAFVSSRDGDGEIYVMNADGTGEARLTENSATDDFPAWSPDGAKIAFASDRDGDSEIYVMNTDGTGVTRLTGNGVWDAYPAWSPDGTVIAFVSGRDGNNEIYGMNADGSRVIRLTSYSGNDLSPVWTK